MIIKGTSRGGPVQLGVYLETAEKNERAKVIEIKGTLAQDLVGALKEMDAYAEGTKCEKPLYHAMISPEPPHRLAPEQIIEAVDLAEKNLGYTGQPRAVIMHEHLGREHFHVVWARIDLEHMRAIPDSHNYRKHEETSRELERRFGHNRIQGAHAERNGQERPDRTPSRSELRQEERTGIRGSDVREEVTALFRSSENAHAFKNALEDRQYILAPGDRRDYVILDCAGGIHSLARRIEGVNAAELREFMKPLKHEPMPTVATAKEIQADRMQGRATLFDELRQEDALVRSVFEREAADRTAARLDAIEGRRALEWDDKLIKAAETKAKLEDEAQRKWDHELRKGRKAARKDAIIQQRYARGEGHASQSRAAQKDYEARHRKLNEGPQRPERHRKKTAAGQFEGQRGAITAPVSGRGDDGHEKSEQARVVAEKREKSKRHNAEAVGLARAKEDELLRRQADVTTNQQQSLSEPVSGNSKADANVSREVANSKRLRFERFLESEEDIKRERDRDDPDRQRMAPGGGRTRSR